MSRARETASDFTIEARGNTGGELRLAFSGRMSQQNLNRIRAELRSIVEPMKPSGLTLDLAGVTYLDSGGALALLEIEQHAEQAAMPCVFMNMSEEARGIIELIDRATVMTPHVPPGKDSEGPIEHMGEFGLKGISDFTNTVTFLGDLLVALGTALMKPRTVRWSDCFFYVRRAGVDGLPIVALLSFLLGLIIAFMSSLQLKQFGANLYVASLVGFGMVRELGPIMTAVIIAGRSGSAFAAEIGTMMVNEEVDALVTMGFNPIRFLALPKVLAAMLVVPLLTLYADLFGILGGMVVGVLGFDLTVYTYLHQTVKSISIFDVVSSLIKAVVFAVLIAGIGCQRGFRVRGGAEAVGSCTTSAVVAGLFLIIVADSLFAIILYYLH